MRSRARCAMVPGRTRSPKEEGELTAIALLCLLFAWPPREGVAAAYAAMSEIAGIHARQILDSRGYPTVELEVTLGSGVIRRAAVPAGESTGRLEAIERRDGGERWSAMGVSAAVSAVKGEIASVLHGRDPQDQADVDRALLALDGTREKSRLGANAILATSLAVARAAAADAGLPLWRHLGGEGAGCGESPGVGPVRSLWSAGRGAARPLL